MERLARVIRAFFRIGRRNIADEKRFIGSDAALGEGGGKHTEWSVQDIDDK